MTRQFVLSFVVIVIVVTIHNKMANSIELNSTQNVDHDIAIIVVLWYLLLLFTKNGFFNKVELKSRLTLKIENLTFIEKEAGYFGIGYLK